MNMNGLTSEIYNEIKAKLMDQQFMNKYGTSVAVNMGREYQKHLEEKYEKLKLEFDKINKNPDDGIDRQELIDFLNSFKKSSGKEINFSEDYVEQLFKFLDLDKNNIITM